MVDIEIVTCEEHDTGRFSERVDAMAATLGTFPGEITAEAAYGTGGVYAALVECGIGYVMTCPQTGEAQGYARFSG